MRFRIFVIGRPDPDLLGYERRLLDRMRHYARCEVIALPQGHDKDAKSRMNREAKMLLGRVGEGFILLDERGRMLTSRHWAERFASLPRSRVQDFVIGGADGVSQQVREKAGEVWSLSALTLPHRLARIILIEQLFRACTLLCNHPYHRE